MPITADQITIVGFKKFFAEIVKEKEKVGIAALLKNPPILILDEATSQLDSQAEILVQQALDELMRGRTVFVIAHRLSTVRNASKIIVLDQGRIAECGSHEELMHQGGLYKRLYELQFRDVGIAVEKR